MFRAGQEDFALKLLQAVCVSLLPAPEPWVASLGSGRCCTRVVLCWSSAEPTSPTCAQHCRVKMLNGDSQVTGDCRERRQLLGAQLGAVPVPTAQPSFLGELPVALQIPSCSQLPFSILLPWICPCCCPACSAIVPNPKSSHTAAPASFLPDPVTGHALLPPVSPAAVSHQHHQPRGSQ